MKIRYSYKNYGENSEATEWSERAGRWSAGGFAIALCIGVLFSEITGSFMLGVIIGIGIVIAVVTYCRKKERECVAAEYANKIKSKETTEQDMVIALLYLHELNSRNKNSKAMLTALCMRGLAKGRNASGEVIYVGRDPQLCQLVFPEDALNVARVHCMLHTDGKKIELRDMKSTGGTYLADGTRLKPDESVELKNGSLFYISNRENLIAVVAGINTLSEGSEKKFYCTLCNERCTGWYQKCPKCGAVGTMKRIENK